MPVGAQRVAAVMDEGAAGALAGPAVSHPVLVFATVLAVILIAPAVARRARLPGLIGLIVAGIALGPHALHVLDRSEAVTLLGTVGLLYIIFIAGLDIDIDQFIRDRRRSVTFGLLSYSIPQVVGTIIAIVVLDFGWLAAVLLGSMFASHTLLAYPIAQRLGITRNRAITSAVGGSIFTDAGSMLVLAIVAAIATGEATPAFWVRLPIALAVYVAAMLIGLPWIGRMYFRKASDGGVGDFSFVLASGFGCAYLATIAGLQPIIGAFLGGLALNRLIPQQSPLMNRLHFVGAALFVPIFLIYVGMLIDLRLLWGAAGEYGWLVAGTMVVSINVLKYLPAKIAQRMLNFTPAEGDVMFALTVPQAAATLAAVLVGLEVELFDESVLNGAVLMILVTCIVGPWVLERRGRAVALAEEEAPDETLAAPLRILVPLANPASAPALMDVALLIRRPDSHEPMYPIVVVSDKRNTDEAVAAGEKMLAHAVIYGAGANVPVTPVTRIDTNVASGITRAVRELRISTVVIGWTGHAPSRRHHLGSVIDQIIEENPQTVLVCRPAAPLNVTKRIVLVLPRLIDRDPSFAESVRVCKVMSSKLGARMHVLSEHGGGSRLAARISSIRPSVSTTFEAINPARGVNQRLEELVEEDDLIALLSAREHRLAWSTELARMPRHLSDAFPATNLVIVFSSEQHGETAWIATSPSGAAALLERDRVTLQLEPMPLAQLIERTLAGHFQHAPDHLAAVRELVVKAANEYSMILSPGLALVHAHVPHAAEPMVFLATIPAGMALPRSAGLARVLIILLSPQALPPEDHLRALANVARMLRSPDLAAHLAGAESFNEVVAMLSEE
jgi:Kef-type K+ transport system membrane component KefB/mannitol/fructose-specific phosphotransferase system IIA component (Ntr-type)